MRNCQICCCVTYGFVIFLVLLLLRVNGAECAIEAFDHHFVLPKNAADAGMPPDLFDRGTPDNMDLSSLGLDLGGTWWMDGNPLADEHLVSFASARGSTPFPAVVHVYNNYARRWTWTDGFVGRLVMAYYAFDAKPESPLTFTFTSDAKATIDPVGGVFEAGGHQLFYFNKISNNEWDRPDANYVLRRIVEADGSPGPFWENFTTWYDAIQPTGNVLVWSSDNGCVRRCQYFMPCILCNALCG